MRDLIDYEINQNQGPFQYWNGNYIDSTDLAVKSVLNLDTEDNSNYDTIDITGIEALTNLVGLRLGDFVYTPFLPQLPNKIQNIDAFQHDILYITNFPDSLQFFECTYNKLTTLPPFNNALVEGRFGSNLITFLPSSLGNIQILSLENNQLTSLPVLPSSLLNFGVSNNHLTSLPTLPNSLINFNCSYQWIDCSSNSQIVGATSQKFIPLISGNYAVIVSSGNCTDTSSCHFISLTSLQENILNKISISPNPTKDQFIISCPKVLNRILTIDVYDSFGKLIQEKLISSESTILNSTSWPSGIYFMEIKSGDSIITRKLVKE